MSTPEIRRLVVISTSHVSDKTAKLLDYTKAHQWPCRGGPYREFGWFVYAQPENERAGRDAVPDDLFAVMQWAQANGFDYILFDCDAEAVDELATYDW